MYVLYLLITSRHGPVPNSAEILSNLAEKKSSFPPNLYWYMRWSQWNAELLQTLSRKIQHVKQTEDKETFESFSAVQK